MKGLYISFQRCFIRRRYPIGILVSRTTAPSRIAYLIYRMVASVIWENAVVWLPTPCLIALEVSGFSLLTTTLLFEMWFALPWRDIPIGKSAEKRWMEHLLSR